MPENNIALSNADALQRGVDRAAWKLKQTLAYFSSPEYTEKQRPDVKFDFRDMNNLIPLLVDMSGTTHLSEEEQKAYFKAELQKIESAFLDGINPKTGMPSGEVVAPFFRRMYDTMATTCNIDWNNEAEIDRLCCSLLSSQTIGTMVEKFTGDMFRTFETKEEKEAIDSISLRSYATTSEFRTLLARNRPELIHQIHSAISDLNTETLSLTMDQEIGRALGEGMTKDDHTVTFDPTSSELYKKFFMGEEFALPETSEYAPEETFSSNAAAQGFLEGIIGVSSKSIFEYQTVKALTDNPSKTEFRREDLLLLNGQPVKELIAERMKNEGLSEDDAKVAVGKTLRDAMTDGHSIVSLVRPTITADGKAAFTHQEVKVDLDKLNKIERNEKHNAFRRMLDYIGIWKIPPKYASNKTRDERQAATKSSSEYQNALKAAEQRFIKEYNDMGEQRTATDNLLNAFPKIESQSKTEETELNQNREPAHVTEDEIEPAKTVTAEPINAQPTEEKVLDEKTFENLVK